MGKLTGRQVDALRLLGRYGFSGARQSRMAQNGVSRSLLLALAGKGLAEWQATAIGNAWYITEAGRAALKSGAPDA
jgi:hypothetical protein